MGPREKPTTIILLKEHGNTTTLNDILLYLEISECITQPSSEKLYLVVDGNSHRDPQLDSVQRERL